MKRLTPQEDRDARQRRRQLIMGVVLIFLMVASSLGYAFSLLTQETSDGSPNGNIPYFDGSGWIVPYAGTQFTFTSSPDEARNVTFEGGPFTLEEYRGKAVYVDAESPAIVREVQNVLGIVALRVQEACYGSCNRTELPEKECNEPVIVWRPGAVNHIAKQQSCVIIDGDNTAVESFLYRALGII